MKSGSAPVPSPEEAKPEALSPEERHTSMLRLVARREHSLMSLMELSQELTVTLDIYGISDLALFNLMGQMGTSKAALWMATGDNGQPPILLRTHGIRKQWARAIGTACGRRLMQGLQETEEILFARDLDGMIGAGPAHIIREAEVALLAPVIAKGKVFGIIALGSRVSGEEYSDVDIRVLHASLGMLGVAIENTGLYNRLLEQHRQLKTANEELKELDRLKSEFLSNVNHELRTPLTIVLAYLDILLDQEREESQRKDFLKTVSSESLKLMVLLENLLNFSEVSSDTSEIRLETGSVPALVRSVHEERLPGVAAGLRELVLAIDEDVPPAQFDPSAVRQILDVLIDNAVKFTPQGSRITLAVRKCDREGNTDVRVDVADDGPGVPPDKVDRIFESFSQGDGSSTRKVGGIGIGLSYARKHAERQGGCLILENDPGLGATFSLILPVGTE